MNKQQAKTRVQKLRKEIEHHRYLYHVLDTQEISDAALDSLKKELFDLEQQYPDLVTPDSPTQRVAGAVLPGFSEVQHTKRMLSLNDLFSFEDILQWEKRNQKIIPGKYKYFIESKIDGVAMSLVYEDGVLTRAATRGDGTVGENVTQNVKTIESIPLALRRKIAGRVEVRGEVYMLKKDFAAMNAARKKEGLPEFANPRNVSAGSIRQLDPAITASRPLRFFAWEIAGGIPVATREEEYKALTELGFSVPPGGVLVGTAQGIQDIIAREEKKKDHYPFQVDGLVIKVNDLSLYERLGIVGKAPRGSAAYKFSAQEATTVVEGIVVQVGRTGTLTPVAHLVPVRVAGTTVSRATLHNADEIQRKDVRVGDSVIVRKAGDIIPEVVRSLPRLRKKGSKPFRMPTVCPICESPVTQDAGGVAIRCSNPECFPRLREKILHAVGRSGFDIEGLGEKIVEQLLQEGLIKDASDLWDLVEGDLLTLDRFGEKSARNIIQEIKAKKTISLPRFLVALGIPHVGVVTAQDIARAFGTLAAVSSASAEDFERIQGIGGKVASAISDFFQKEETKEILKKYKALGVKIISEKAGGVLAGKTFVFTGTLTSMTREEAKQKVIAAGGRMAASVGKDVTYVVVGEDAGSKAKKAEQLGIRTITEEEFASLIHSPL